MVRLDIAEGYFVAVIIIYNVTYIWLSIKKWYLDMWMDLILSVKGLKSKNWGLFSVCLFCRRIFLLVHFALLRQSFLPYLLQRMESQKEAERSWYYRPAIWLAGRSLLGYKRDPYRLGRETLRGFWQYLYPRKGKVRSEQKPQLLLQQFFPVVNPTLHKMCKGLAGLPASCLRR